MYFEADEQLLIGTRDRRYAGHHVTGGASGKGVAVHEKMNGK